MISKDRSKQLVSKFLVFLFILVLLVIPYFSFYSLNRSKTYDAGSVSKVDESYTTGIVFGAGTIGGQPNRILKSRLDLAGDLYRSELIEKILISGSNIEGHKEIEVMSSYLITNYQVAQADLLLDGYGLRSFDTCIRAKNVYDIDNAILLTSSYHLPRVQFLCEKLGVEQIGIGSRVNDPNGEVYYLFREFLASYKALIDLYIYQPDFIDDEWELVESDK